MNIPLLHELQHPGFHKLSFTPPYDPIVLVLDKEASKGVGPAKLPDELLVEPNKGVFVLIEPLTVSPVKYNVYVGCAGVGKGENKPEDDRSEEDSQTLYARIRDLRSSVNIKDMNDWEKAILICDWEKDIGTEEEGTYHDRDVLIAQVMRNEAFHLSKILHKKIGDEKNPKWNVLGKDPASYYMPNPDSLRYQYYVEAVKQLLRMIAK